ncbi:hypothetical protein WDW89_16670 [Deltaproteobacteria bacterium TL4]
MEWDKSSTVHFFRQQHGQKILIQESETRAQFRGYVTEIYALNLCSRILEETTLKLKTPNMEIALTFHDDFLGIHVMVPDSAQQTLEVSLPYQIKYPNLTLTVLDSNK